MFKQCTFEKDGFESKIVESNQIVYITYPAYLTPQVTTQMYEWFTELYQTLGVASVNGCIFDFRQVEKFHPSNLKTAQKESRKINEQFDLKAFPVAFWVENLLQEQMLRVSMQLTQNSERLRVVHSEEDALSFFAEWAVLHGEEHQA